MDSIIPKEERVRTMYSMVTNNSKCRDRFESVMTVDFLPEGTYMDVLVKVRDYIHKGYRLETHPMAGSLKPNQIPFKTVVVSRSDIAVDKQEFYDQDILIENCISTCEKFMKDRTTPDWPESIREDFRDVDLSLLEGAANKFI